MDGLIAVGMLKQFKIGIKITQQSTRTIMILDDIKKFRVTSTHTGSFLSERNSWTDFPTQQSLPTLSCAAAFEKQVLVSQITSGGKRVYSKRAWTRCRPVLNFQSSSLSLNSTACFWSVMNNFRVALSYVVNSWECTLQFAKQYILHSLWLLKRKL